MNRRIARTGRDRRASGRSRDRWHLRTNPTPPSFLIVVLARINMEVSQKKPWLLNFRSSETFIVIVVSIAIFTVRSLAERTFLPPTNLPLGRIYLRNGISNSTTNPSMTPQWVADPAIDCPHHPDRAGRSRRCPRRRRCVHRVFSAAMTNSLQPNPGSRSCWPCTAPLCSSDPRCLGGLPTDRGGEISPSSSDSLPWVHRRVFSSWRGRCRF